MSSNRKDDRGRVCAEKLKAVTDCLGHCHFTTRCYDSVLVGSVELARRLGSAAGINRGPHALLDVGDRVQSRRKAFNTPPPHFIRGNDCPHRDSSKSPSRQASMPTRDKTVPDETRCWMSTATRRAGFIALDVRRSTAWRNRAVRTLPRS